MGTMYSMTDVFIDEGEDQTQRHRRCTWGPCEERGRIWRWAATSEEMWREPQPSKLKDEEGVWVLRAEGPPRTNTMVSDLQSAEQRECMYVRSCFLRGNPRKPAGVGPGNRLNGLCRFGNLYK